VLDCRSIPRLATLSSLGKYGDKAPSNPFSLFFPRAAPPNRLAPSYPQASPDFPESIHKILCIT